MVLVTFRLRVVERFPSFGKTLHPSFIVFVRVLEELQDHNSILGFWVTHGTPIFSRVSGQRLTTYNMLRISL